LIWKIASYALFFILGMVCAKYWLALHVVLPAPDANVASGEAIFQAMPKFSFSVRVLSLAAALSAAIALVGTYAGGFRNPLPRDSTVSPDSKDRWHLAQGSNRSPVREKDIENAGRGLEKQLAQIVEILREYLNDTNAQSLVYEEMQVSLASADTIEQVQAVVQVLLTSSIQAKRDAEELKGRLNRAQSETAMIREKLVRAEKLAALDGLTSLPNRRSLEEFLRNAVADSHLEHTPLSLVMADLDHFKRINDSFGHQAGDAVIKAFSRIFSENVRSTDMVARYGGEEFAIVLPRTPMGNASFVVERIRKVIEATDWVDPISSRPIERVTASFGIAEIMDGETPEKIIERADQKLYCAKRNGRNRVEIGGPQRA
jgi:diguanylate cyclase